MGLHEETDMTAAIMALLKEVYDPELGVNIVDLGLVYGVECTEGSAKIIMTLTTPGCPMHDMLVGGVKRAAAGLPGVREVQVQVVWEPQWSPEQMSEEAKGWLGYI
ncbi:metal-sulfur cluster assembly factor [Paenibacillus terreus]|uniref:Metal-sulfur cluster assembly factor n=1 Tax=Paenibacillus terreus TaxID=1387834 RepID=A0ABV5B2P4_9BACL